MLRLVIPWAAPYLEPATRLFGVRNDATFVNLTSNPYGYWQLFCDLWDGGERFAICEHDIVPMDSQLRELDECPEPWCVFAYDHTGTEMASLGFCAFDPERLRTPLVSDVWSVPQLTQESREHLAAAGIIPAASAEIRWNHVDGAIFTALTTRGYTPHRHEARVTHRPTRKGN